MTTHLQCKCGKVQLAVHARPIVVAECHCDSCRKAGARLAQLPGAEPVTEPNGGTHFVLHRKDRLRFAAGAEHLGAYRLTPQSPTRRVIATCCNTPIFLEFQHGHWLSLYAHLWPEADRPRASMRTMTSDLPPGHELAGDIPNHRTQSLGFFARLLLAWAAMGFRSPTITVPNQVAA